MMLIFNSHYIPVKVIARQDPIVVSHSYLLYFTSKQAAIDVSHSYLSSVFVANIFPLDFSPHFYAHHLE